MFYLNFFMNFCNLVLTFSKEELCDKLLSGEIPEETILVNPKHYCEYKSAGMTFRLTD